MAKKRPQKKRGKNKSTSIAHLSINQLAKAGQASLHQGKFAEAIKAFRRLMQESKDEKWAEPLRSSFQGRINQLVAKGMHKEALVIFHNMETQLPDQALALHNLHILLLIQAKQTNKAQELFEKSKDTLSREHKQRIEETFAALLLSNNNTLNTLVEKFPPDAPLRSQFPHAQKALRCYALGQDTDALESLQHIPFRSPYKKFCMALKGMIAFYDEQDKARSFFDKIDVDSPFSALISPYLHMLEDAKERENDKKILGKTEKQAVQLLLGLDKAKIKFIASLKNNAATPGGFFRCLLNAGTCLDSTILKPLCHRLLAYEPSYLRLYEKKFGPIKDEFEYARLQALALEIENESPQIIEKWRQACAILAKRKNPDDALKIALIHRHIAGLISIIHGEKHGQRNQREELEKSLAYDPKDKATWLRIHQLLHLAPAEQYRWVNRMLEHFPREPDILFLGVEAAVRRSAFKKASGLARELLKIDPINKKVRKLLIGAHINHAHKLAHQKKYVLACKECHHASAFDRGHSDQGRIEITHGLIELLQGEEKEGLALLEKGESRYTHQAIARFQVCMDAELLSMPPEWKKKFSTNLKAAVKKTPGKEELLQIITCLMDSNGNKLSAWKKVRVTLLPYVKKGSGLTFHKDELILICQSWHRMCEFALLHAYGKKAAQQWPEVPLFKYYIVVGKSQDGKKRLTNKDIEELEDASHTAMRQKDSATEKLIDDFLDKNVPADFFGGPPMGLLAGLFEEEFFGDDDEKKKPSKEEIKKFFELFGDF